MERDLLKRNCIAGFDDEDGAKGKDRRWPVEAGKGKDTDSPLEPPEGTSLADTLTMAR